MAHLILQIARKSLKEGFRNKIFWTIAGILYVLLIFSSVVSLFHYQKKAREFDDAQRLARTQWEQQTAKNPHSAAHYGTFAFKPISALSVVENGLDKYLGVSIFLEAHKQNLSQYKQIAEQNDMARFVELTPAFVLVYLMPLLLIIVGYQVYVGEKEQKTLSLVFSQGVSPWQLVAGKALYLWTVLLLLILPAALLGLLFLLQMPFRADDFYRYAWFLIGLLLYLGSFIHLIVVVSRWSPSSNVALLSLLGFWMMATLFVPKLAVNFSKAIYPASSVLEYQAKLKQDLEKGIDGHDPFSAKAKLFQDSVLKANRVDSVHKLPFNYAGLVMQAGEEHETVVYAKSLQNLHNTYLSQLKVHYYLAMLSPTILMKTTAMQLAHTDLQTHYDFAQQAEKFRIALVRQLNYDIKDNARYNDWEYKPQDKDFFKKTVAFEYHPRTLQKTLPEMSATLTGLCGWCLASLGLLWWAARRVSI
ncbi:MAG TPA: hypothetical protein DCM08_08980 [Microscillaceae bacterium]|nr:hypothetical protein [Microscillaceae bacterium]